LSGSSPLRKGLRKPAIPRVVAAEYRGGHRIHLWFSDNSAKVIDFRKWLDGPVFEPLKDAAYFQRFFLGAGTIGWPNGADIAPETLYQDAGVPKGAAQADAADEVRAGQTPRPSQLVRVLDGQLWSEPERV
jgi:hypothetical protein